MNVFRKLGHTMSEEKQTDMGPAGAKSDQIYAVPKAELSQIADRLNGLQAAHDNESTAINNRLDELKKAYETQLDRIRAKLDDIAGQGDGGKQTETRASDDDSEKLQDTSKFKFTKRSLQPTATARPLPEFKPIARADANGSRKAIPTNALDQYQPLFDQELKPWQGEVPKGYLADFLGVLTDGSFRTQYGIDPAVIGGGHQNTDFPTFKNENGEWWFEAVNWFEAAREARDRFVMITLGACYGAQAVGAYRTMKIVNPDMPIKLVAVEPVPENYEWVRKHFMDNGIDPDDHWLVPTAISDRNDPVLFPVGAAGSGANNCVATNKPKERKILADRIIANGKAVDTLRALMVENSTKIVKNLLPDQESLAELKFVSSLTLRDFLGPFDYVDYLEADIQESEIVVFPPFMDLLRKKVRRIHMGTHGTENHRTLHKLFVKHGWEIIFSYEPDATHNSPLGPFVLNDGVLSMRNPHI